MSLARLTRNYLGFQIAFALLFWLPVFYEVQRRLGLSDSQIFGIQSFYYLFFCLLELPTGWLADRFGSIRTLRAGAIALISAQLVVVAHQGWFSVHSTFFWHFALIAAARSLVSGASNAYLYEAYAEAGRSSEYVHLEGRARAYGLLAKIVCWSVVGFLTERSLLSSYWLTLISAIAATFFAFRLPERSRVRAAPRIDKAIWTALRVLAGEPRLLGFMLQGMGVFVLARVVQVNLFQPLLLSREFSVSSLGWIMALVTGAEVLASLRLAPILKRVNAEKSVGLLSALTAASVVALAWGSKWGTLVVLLFFSAALGFAGPIQRQVINNGITRSARGAGLRATLLSLESLLDRAVCSVVVAFMGPWVQEGRLSAVLFATGAGFFGIAGLQLFERRRRVAKTGVET